MLLDGWNHAEPDQENIKVVLNCAYFILLDPICLTHARN